MRYVMTPPPVTVRDCVTGEETNDVVSFAKSIRIALMSIASKGTADAGTLLDIRRKGDRAEVGRYIEFSDDEWKLLEPEFKRPNPQVVTARWIFSAEDHQRAILDAVTKLPAALKAPEEDVAAHAEPARAANGGS